MTGSMEIEVSGDIVDMVAVTHVFSGVIVIVAGVMPGAVDARVVRVAETKVPRPRDISIPNSMTDVRGMTTASTVPAVAAPTRIGRNTKDGQSSQDQSEH